MTDPYVSVIVDSVETSLTDGTLGVLEGLDGFGLSPLHEITERGPLQDGETMRDLRLDPRVLRVLLGLPGSSWDDMVARRETLLALFRPRRAASHTLVWYDGSNEWLILGSPRGGLVMPSADQEGFYQRVVLSLYCPDPTFYKAEQTAEAFGVGLSGGTGFTVPMSVPLGIGASSIDETRGIVNSGTWETFPVITIDGPVTSCVIENETTGEKLDFTGIAIGSTGQRIIDCAYGVKSVVDESGTNKVSDLSDDSDLATFHLAVDQ